ncbi:hypothetical protein CBM2589_B180066 [Cupriavidus taiwanensis]|uniref:Uncharacterized protein n=1 Tax=Cupriavidus taiwanensis TaxID=164546 RepID=A0A975WX94_9BURK|nr:hypothetical protein CBM2589_B180066 [Cupriavidus taiwanensis]
MRERGWGRGQALVYRDGLDSVEALPLSPTLSRKREREQTSGTRSPPAQSGRTPANR